MSNSAYLILKGHCDNYCKQTVHDIVPQKSCGMCIPHVARKITSAKVSMYVLECMTVHEHTLGFLSDNDFIGILLDNLECMREGKPSSAPRVERQS